MHILSRWSAVLLRVIPKMIRGAVTRFFSVLVVLVVWPVVANASDGPLLLKRGVSLASWSNEETPSGDDRRLPHRDLARIKSLGFDFVRLSVSAEPLLASADGRRDEAADRLERAVRTEQANYGSCRRVVLAKER